MRETKLLGRDFSDMSTDIATVSGLISGGIARLVYEQESRLLRRI